MTDGINVQNEISALNWQGTSDDAVKWVQLPHENKFYLFTLFVLLWAVTVLKFSREMCLKKTHHSDITDLIQIFKSVNKTDLYDTS